MKAPVISPALLLLAVLLACVGAASYPTIGEKWHYREDINVNCLKCHGHSYFVAHCELESEPRSHCEKCPAQQYQAEEWHLNRECLDNSTWVYTDRPCPEDTYDVGGECRPCPEHCPEGWVRRPSSACRGDGTIMCCLGNYGKENGNVMCSWMNADKIGRLSRNQKEAAFTKVKESKSESEPKERSSTKVKESKSESEPKERISKEFGKDKETGSGQEHYGGVAGVCILIVVVVVVVCTIAAAGKEGRAHLCRILQDCWQKIRRGGPRFAATTSRRVPVSFRRRLNSITTI